MEQVTESRLLQKKGWMKEKTLNKKLHYTFKIKLHILMCSFIDYLHISMCK